MVKTHEIYYPMYENKDKFIILITGGRSSGKALELHESVRTPYGWVKMSDIEEGDEICSVNGGTQRVTKAHPIEEHEYYRVSFADGTNVTCSSGHLWTISSGGTRIVVDTEVLRTYVRHGRWSIDMCAPCKRLSVGEQSEINDALRLAKGRDGKYIYRGGLVHSLTFIDTLRSMGYFVRQFKLSGETFLYIDARTRAKAVVKVEPIGRRVGRCISVSDASGLFITNDYNVTHNSFQVGTFIERLTFELGEVEAKRIAHHILYTRYTMTSANISVIPEFLEKVSADGTEKYFHKTRTDVTNVSTGATVMFRGIHTSSGNQTAKLKSIHGITTFVVDEAEEWVSEQEFDTIMLSIRQKGLQNRIIIIMNPTDSNHFIYQRYIKDTHKIEYFDGVPVQISTHPNVLHIHTTYLDNREHCGEQFLKEVESMKINNPEKYAHIVMGQWADVAEGAIFKNWGIVDDFPSNAKNVGKGLDFGYSCIRKDVKISTLREEIPICEVVEGDMVLTRKGYRRVNKVLDRGEKDTLTRVITINDQETEITATADHRFYANGDWKPWGDLCEGDILSKGRIDKIETTSKEIGHVYDLSVDGEHEFFANGILVHNCDPSACVKFGEVYSAEGVDLYLDEQFYKQGMLIADLIAELKAQDPKLFVYADSADPRLIDEIALGGVIIYGIVKGGGSILAGIEKMKDYNHIFVTKRSVNLQHELRNYTWDRDKDNNYVNVPIDAFNHAIDASRYGILGRIMGKVIRKEQKQKMTSKGGRSVANRAAKFGIN